MKPAVFRDILKVRDSGKTNMFDIEAVKYWAVKLDCLELFWFLSDKNNFQEYCCFIINGE